jgi:hypothetical protein
MNQQKKKSQLKAYVKKTKRAKKAPKIPYSRLKKNKKTNLKK